jgi:hypothetical protein
MSGHRRFLFKNQVLAHFLRFRTQGIALRQLPDPEPPKYRVWRYNRFLCYRRPLACNQLLVTRRDISERVRCRKTAANTLAKTGLFAPIPRLCPCKVCGISAAIPCAEEGL